MGIQQNNELNVCQINLPANFLQMLASTLMKDADGTVLGFNFIVDCTSQRETCDCEPVVDCNTNHVPPESLLINGFGIDVCGHLAIKLVNCDGTVTCLGESPLA